MDNKVELRVLNISNSQLQANAFALVLEEVNGQRQLPVIIGSIEAQAIALKLKGLTTPRPFTHDLFVTFAEYLQTKLTQVFIYKARDGIFYSYLYFEKEDGESFKIDSRTSDAVALALRFDTPIYTTEEILSAEGYIPEVEEETDESDMYESLESLKEALSQAIKDEDYELASELRDEIKQREQEEKSSNQ